MAPSPSSNGATTSVQVALRIRPPTNQDSTSIPARFQRTVINASSPTTVAVDATTSTPSSVGSSTAAAAPTSSTSAGKKQTFTFDQVHGPATTQHALFTSTAQPLISRFVDGFNCTILAYGQTSSGKTFTMTGVDLDADPMDPSNLMGIIPRAIAHIFARCRELKEERGTAWNFNIKGSFIEVYNEDLLDLLSVDGTGAKAAVQIREDKQGHILWEGLREVNVKNSHEVMNLIRQGTSIRRTNETDMNAQSSRSHAIFSLTLTQKKYTGSTPPPRSSSPLPPNGRSPSRLARPASTMYGGGANANRVGSPTFGRPGTPSFTSAIGRGGSRPASSMGMLTADGGRRQSLAPGGAQTNGDNDTGDWVTVVSKFHFVDLAGSERLKRTAAAGDRIKEGISINSGLLALGNVISALGDPAKAKSHTASYVPYRDSKLTRLLQDSLGGNAHTLMIACVSPAEWNANETLNTLKYANRARNIKNRAVLNEKEDGWDDVEWLQAQVTRLRKEVKAIKEGGGTTMSAVGEPQVSEATFKKNNAQIAELRSSYEEMREKYVERTEELTRLRRELAEKQRASGGSIGGTAKYEEIVGPVIEEYEKTISAMEAELSLNRAALRHTNDLVDEKEVEMAQLTERHATTEMYVAELRARVAKLSEREQSTEAYIHDLEEKVKLFNEDNLSSSGSISDLKRELAKFQSTESHSSQYIHDLETRLAKSDESVLSLQQSVERLEEECEARRAEVKSLETQLENIQRDGEGWRDDLEHREQKIQKMEADLLEREEALKAAAETRERLGAIVNGVSEARKNLEVSSAASTKSEVSSIHESDNVAETQLIALQQTHTATLADLSSVSAKYRDALREIADLAAQLQEAKVNASIPPTPLSESPERPTEVPSPRRRMVRGASKDGLDGQVNGSSRRILYKHPASMDSLHSRSVSQSVSLSQELSSARSRKASISSHSTSSSVSLSSPRPNLSLNVSPNERSVQSLQREIMRLQEVLKERESEITALEQSLDEREKSRKPAPALHALSNGDSHPVENGESTPDLHLSPRTMGQFQELRHTLDGMPSPADPDESLLRLNELMRSMAQKESSHREAIDKLNGELNQVRRQHDELTVLSRDQALNMANEIEGLQAKREEDLARLEELQRREAEITESLKRARDEHAAFVEQLKADHEAAIRAKEVEVDALLARSKEDHAAAIQAKEVEVNALLARSKEDHDTAFHTLCDQLANASAQLETAQREHEEAFGSLKAEHADELKRRSEEVDRLLASVRSEHETELQAALQKHQAELKEVIELRQAEHDEELRQRSTEHTAAVSQIRKEYDDAIAKLISDHQESARHKEEESSSTLQRTEEEYYEALTKLRQAHAQALEKQATEAAIAIERLKDEQAQALHIAEIAREGSLTQSHSAQEIALKDLQEAHAAAIATKESNFAADLQKTKDEHAATLSAKEEQHRSNVQRLKADHSVTLHAKEVAHNEQVEKLESEHARALAARDAAYQEELKRLSETHAAELKKLREETAAQVAQLASELERSREEHSTSASTIRKELEESLQRTKEEHAAALEEVGRGHEEKVSQLQADRDAALADAQTQAGEERRALTQSHAEELARLKADAAALEEARRAHEEQLHASHQAALADAQAQVNDERNSLAQSHTEELARLKAEHHTAIAAIQSDLVAAQEQHRQALEESREQTERLVNEEKTRLAVSLEDLKNQQAEEVSMLRKDVDLLQVERSQLASSLHDLEAKHAEELMSLQEERDSLAEENMRLAANHTDSSSRQAAELALLQQEHEMVIQELESYKSSADEHVVAREEIRQKYEAELREKTDILDSLQEDLSAVHAERDALFAEVAGLRTELDNTRSKTSELVSEASKRQSLVDELERHRSVLADLQENLQKTKDEMDTLQNEKNIQDAILRDLQAQLTRSPSPGTSRFGSARPNGLPAAKLPPLTPLPSPPSAIPPTLKSMHEAQASTSSSAPMSPTSARSVDFPDTTSTPATSVTGSTFVSGAPDAKLTAQIQEKTKQLEEQEVMIKTLNKQLSHCESDLQAHMDMVATLETSLADSEKNLRKARMQATEIARERDNLNTQLSALRQELHDAKTEMVNVRQSIVEEKQSLEHRLDEERRQKERARQQLDSRMDELQRRKSKFACL